MIKKKTVFVLGAGASQDYGFPSGAGLVDLICEELKEADGGAARMLRAVGGHPLEDIKQFRRRLLESLLNSIDAFLQRRQEYGELGKAARVNFFCERLKIRSTRPAMLTGIGRCSIKSCRRRLTTFVTIG